VSLQVRCEKGMIHFRTLHSVLNFQFLIIPHDSKFWELMIAHNHNFLFY